MKATYVISVIDESTLQGNDEWRFLAIQAVPSYPVLMSQRQSVRPPRPVQESFVVPRAFRDGNINTLPDEAAQYYEDLRKQNTFAGATMAMRLFIIGHSYPCIIVTVM